MSLEKAIAALAPHYGCVTVKHQQQGEKSVTTLEFSGKRKPVIGDEKYKQAAEMANRIMSQVYPGKAQKMRPLKEPRGM